jgi:hypothetical protein
MDYIARLEGKVGTFKPKDDDGESSAAVPGDVY